MRGSDGELREKIIETIYASTETERTISDDTALYEDMGLSSMEVYILLCDLEDRFRVRIPAAVLRRIRTVGDLCRAVSGVVKGK